MSKNLFIFRSVELILLKSLLRYSLCIFGMLMICSTSTLGQTTITSGSQTTITYTTVGSYTFTVPAMVSSVTIKAWGGGGGGQAVASGVDEAGGGGGGGAYTYYTLTGLTAGSTYTVRVGSGGSQGVKGDSSTFESPSAGIIVKAVGGNANTVTIIDKTVSNVGGTGGQASLCIPSNVAFSGGNGGTGGPGGAGKKGGGGGGSSAGPNGSGNNGTSVTNSDNGGVGGSGDGSNSGAGGKGGDNALSGSNGSQPGGGGGGEGAKASTSTPTGGTGGNGQVIISYTTPNSLNAFRSLTSGSWNNTSSWQQKYNDGNWYASTTYPTSLYGSISSSTSGYPVIVNDTTSSATSNTTNHTVRLPSGISAGDLLVILWADHLNGLATDSATTPSGWTRIFNSSYHTSKHKAYGWYKIAAGNESTVTVTTTVAEKSAHISYIIKAGTFEGVPVGTSAGNLNSANPPPLSSGFGAVKTKWIASSHSDDATGTIASGPSNFTYDLTVNLGKPTIRSANIDSTVATVDPGVFGGTISEGAAATIAIKGKVLNTYSTEKSIVTVRNGHTIAITDNATADTVNVESGGLLKFDLPNSNGKSTLSLDISSGSPMTITGTLEAADQTYISGAGSFTLASGGTIKVGSHEGLTSTAASGNVRVTGGRTFHPLANYYFNHNGNQNTGNAVTAAANMYIQGGGIKTLSAPITISNSLTLTDGYPYTTSTNLLTIANGATISGGSDDTYVIGPLRKVGTNSIPNYSFVYPVGIPIVFNNSDKTKTNNSFSPVKIKYPNVSSDNITFTITHYHASPTTLTPKMDGVFHRMTNREFEQEYWDVHNDVAGTSGAITNVLGTYGVDVTLYFDNPNGNSKQRTSYYLTHAKTTADSTFWEIPNITTQQFKKDTTAFGKRMLYVSVFGQKNFSGMGATGTDETTPVTLTNFNARLTPENKVALSWATASESVNKGFNIERQHDAGETKFHNIGFVPSKAEGGNSAQLLYYNFTDIAPKLGSTSYYRLVQEDIDGKLTNSEVRMIRLNGQSVSLVYPNPSKGDFLISRTADGKKMNIQVADLSGRIIKQINGIESATHKLFIQQPGIYNIKLTYPETGEQSIQRVIVH